MTRSITLQGVPLPLDDAWLINNQAYLSGDARLVRAALRMLQGAWFSDLPGSLPASRQEIADLVGLTEHELLQHYDVLTAGWVLNGEGRLTHSALQELALEVIEAHGKDLLRLRARTAAAVACPEQFDLLPGGVSKARGKTKLPSSFEPEPQTLAKLHSEGFTTPKRVDWIVDKFRTHYLSKGDKLIDWQAGLVNFAKKEKAYERPWNQVNSHWSEPGHEPPAARPSPFAQQKAAVRQSNEHVFGLAPGGAAQPAAPAAPVTAFAAAAQRRAASIVVEDITPASFREAPRA